LLRRFAHLAGVHTYVDTDDVVWASKDLLAVSVAKGGTRRLSLPRKATVHDLYTGTELARDTDSFETPFADLETRVFVLK